MRFIHRRSRRGNSNLVFSPKSDGAILAPSPLHRDVLIQSSLDPHVRFIRTIDPIRSDLPSTPARPIVLDRDDGCYLIEIVDPSYPRPRHQQVLFSQLHLHGASLIELTFDEVRREPRFGNARRVWEFSSDDPPARRRERILDALHERGPRTIYELERLLGMTDALPAVCAMACANLVEIDIDTDLLGARTIVRPRR